MKNYIEYHYNDNERLVHIPTGKMATFISKTVTVKGINFDSVKFDDGYTMFYYPYEITEKFRRLYNSEKVIDI
jgi:hypothetical protein